MNTDSFYSYSLSQYLNSLVSMLHDRIPRHAHTQKSSTLTHIHTVCAALSELLTAVAFKNIPYYVDMITTNFITTAYLKKCIVKTPKEDAASVQTIRNSILHQYLGYLLWTRRIIISLVEANVDKNCYPALCSVQDRLNAEIDVVCTSFSSK